MNAILSKICALLKSPRLEHQVAAAAVLGELQTREPAAIRALTGALSSAQRPARLAILEALGRIGSPLAVPDLLPLIDSSDEEVRDRAIRALVGVGPAAIRPIERRAVDAAPASRRALIGVLSRVRTAESVDALLGLLESGHPEAPREAAQALLALGHSMTRPEQARLQRRLMAILASPPDRAQGPALSASLQVLPAVGRPADAVGLLKLLSSRYTEAVRRDAMLAISGLLKRTSAPARVLTGLLSVIQDSPSPALRSAGLEVLGGLELPASSLPAILALLDHADPAVRRFAARKLGGGQLGGMKAARRLAALLSDTDPSLRDAAAESLGRIPESAGLLVEELGRCDDVHRAWMLAQILKHHVSKLRRPVVRGLFDEAVEALTSDDRLWEPLLYVVRHHDPRLMYDWLMGEAARFKKARKYAEAEACLKPLSRVDHFDSEARYALALAGVKATRARGAGGGASIDLFRQLVRDPAFPLLDRLKKERAHLQTEDLYQLGFQLAEGTAEEKAVGAELLRTVAARAGTTKLGRSARSKLKSEGLAGL